MLKHLTPSDFAAYASFLVSIAGLIGGAARWLERRHKAEMAEAEKKQAERADELRGMIREESGKILAEFKPNSGHTWFDKFQERMTEVFDRLDKLERRRENVFPEPVRDSLPNSRATRRNDKPRAPRAKAPAKK